MSARIDIWITRVAPGTIQWEEWWVRRHGENLGRTPTEDDQISFANFDLTNNGYPRVSRIDDRLVVSAARQEHLSGIEEVLSYHGFSVERVSAFGRHSHDPS